MARRNELEYELARIELDKRRLQLDEHQLELERKKLQLESKELDFRQELTQLNTVDLTEDDGFVKSESLPRTTDSSQTSNRNTTSTEPIVDETTTASIKESVSHEQDTIVVERPVKLGSTITIDNAETSASSRPAVHNLTTYANSVQPKSPPVAAPSPQCSPPAQLHVQQHSPPAPVSASRTANSMSQDQDILKKFLGPLPKVDKSETQSESKRTNSSRSEHIKALILKRKNKEEDATKSDSGDSSKAKRRRTSRMQSKQEPETSGAITESEQYELISQYTDVFLKHMQAAEKALDAQAGKNAIAARVRHLNVGRTHPSITLLHREFNTVAMDHAKTPAVRSALQAELDKFEDALPYWSPKCKGLTKQANRQKMITETFKKIADGDFNVDDYEDDYDPYDEL